MSKTNKHHLFHYTGSDSFIGSLCGIKNRDGIIFNTGKEMNCLRCKKKSSGIRRNK